MWKQNEFTQTLRYKTSLSKFFLTEKWNATNLESWRNIKLITFLKSHDVTLFHVANIISHRKSKLHMLPKLLWRSKCFQRAHGGFVRPHRAQCWIHPKKLEKSFRRRIFFNNIFLFSSYIFCSICLKTRWLAVSAFSDW